MFSIFDKIDEFDDGNIANEYLFNILKPLIGFSLTNEKWEGKARERTGRERVNTERLPIWKAADENEEQNDKVTDGNPHSSQHVSTRDIEGDVSLLTLSGEPWVTVMGVDVCISLQSLCFQHCVSLYLSVCVGFVVTDRLKNFEVLRSYSNYLFTAKNIF